MPNIVLLPEFGEFGGTRALCKAWLRFYAENGFNVSVGLTSEQLDTEMVALLEQYQFKHALIPKRPSHLRRIWFRFPFSALFDLYCIWILRLRKKPDAIATICGTAGMFMGLVVLPVPLIYVLVTNPGTFPDTLKTRVKKSLLTRLLTCRKAILTDSYSTRSSIISSWVWPTKSDRVKVIHNTAGPPVFPGATQSDRDGTCVRILTLGHVTGYKNPEVWIEVARAVLSRGGRQSIEFLWAGDGDLLDSCRIRIQELGLTDSIHFVGYRKDVDELYRGAHVYFQPSLLESHGISVVHAMRFSLPCVVSNVGGLPESVVDRETGFVVDVNSKDAMVDRILDLVSDEMLRKRMGLAAASRYASSFSLEIWEQKMNALHSELLESKARKEQDAHRVSRH